VRCDKKGITLIKANMEVVKFNLTRIITERDTSTVTLNKGHLHFKDEVGKVDGPSGAKIIMM
jgi:hypothetical protein